VVRYRCVFVICHRTQQHGLLCYLVPITSICQGSSVLRQATFSVLQPAEPLRCHTPAHVAPPGALSVFVAVCVADIAANAADEAVFAAYAAEDQQPNPGDALSPSLAKSSISSSVSGWVGGQRTEWGELVHTYVAPPVVGHVHPSFGELALLYGESVWWCVAEGLLCGFGCVGTLALENCNIIHETRLCKHRVHHPRTKRLATCVGGRVCVCVRGGGVECLGVLRPMELIEQRKTCRSVQKMESTVQR
jgi:hypothetical protein